MGLLEIIVCFSFYLLYCCADNQKHTGLFCKDHVGPHVLKWKNLTQDTNLNYIIIKLKSDDLVDLERASKVCRQCHDAQVISQMDVPNLPHASFPAWINLTARISESPDETRTVTWGDHASPVNLTQDEIVWIHWRIMQSYTYALLALPPSDVDIRWAALPQEKSYYNFSTRQIAMDFFVVQTIVCRRPTRKSCHYWTTEGERCVFHPKFGCHTYKNFMSQPPDDADNGTVVCSEFRRTAKRCPLTKCSCPVTQWTEWSDCDETYCTTLPSNRTRYRQVVEPCPIGWVHEILNQSEPCPLPENCQILANDFTMNDSLILRDSN